MSAVLVVPARDRIHVMTDAAFYDAEGVLLATAPKIYALPRTRAVFTSRGPIEAFPAFLAACDAVDYDGLDGLAAKLAEIWGNFETLMGGFADPLEIVIAGWSSYPVPHHARDGTQFRASAWGFLAFLRPAVLRRRSRRASGAGGLHGRRWRRGDGARARPASRPHRRPGFRSGLGARDRRLCLPRDRSARRRA